MPTIVDIARKANTSPAAVSYALNNHPTGVSADTRKRILSIAKEMGYRPNRRARQLRKGANMTIGFQVSSHVATRNHRRQVASLTLTIFQGASTYAAEQGYHTQLLMPVNDDMAEFRRIIIQENAVDGLIFLGHQNLDDREMSQFARDLNRVKVPAVTLDRRMAAFDVPVVVVDRETGLRDALHHIADLGHQSVAYIGHLGQSVDESRPRLQFIRQTLAERGVALHDRHVLDTLHEVDAYRALLGLLGLKAKDRPTCVIFSGDHLTMASLRALEDRGMTTPRDISILSMNNAPYLVESPIAISTVDFHYANLGRTMAKILIDRIQRPQDPIQAQTVLASRYVAGQSIGPAAIPARSR